MTIPCPGEEKLVDYIEGRLSEQDRSQVEEHLADCPICLEGFVVMNSMVRDKDRFESDPVPTEVTEAAFHLISGRTTKSRGSLIEKMKRSIADLESSILDLFRLKSLLKWQPASIRGSKTAVSEDLVFLRVPIGQIETEIEIEKTALGKALIRVRLHEAIKPAKRMRVTLKRGEREMASDLLDRDYVLFEDIPFGRYSLSLAGNGEQLGVYRFEIRESRHGKR